MFHIMARDGSIRPVKLPGITVGTQQDQVDIVLARQLLDSRRYAIVFNHADFAFYWQPFFHFFANRRSSRRRDWPRLLAYLISTSIFFLLIRKLCALFRKQRLKKNELVCIQRAGRNVSIAISNISNPYLKDYLTRIEKEEGYKLSLYICSPTAFRKTLKKYQHISLVDHLEELRLSLSGKDLEEFEAKLKDVIDLKKRITEIPTTEVINIVMAGAVKMEASDIHFEPQQEGIRLRYRIDGVLQNITVLPPQIYHYIISRIKVLAGMKINIRDISQDGHFSVAIDKSEVDVRVSILPGNLGENIVMRLLNQQVVALNFEDLGTAGAGLR